MIQPLSPFRRGADNGFRFGAYLTAIYALMVVGDHVPLLGILTLALMAGVPAMIYLLLRRDRTLPGGLPTLGALWIDGLLTFLGGGILAGAVMMIYLNWIEPAYLADNLQHAIAMLDSSPDPQSHDLAEQMRTAIDNGFSISPIMFTMMTLWLVATSGSVLSLVIAAIIIHKHPIPKSSDV